MADRIQHYCGQCREHTLHELDADPVNHLAHLLVTLLFCGLWLPIWILVAITAPRREHRCMTCGQVPGERTPRKIAEDQRRAEADRERRAAEAKIRSAQNAEARGRAIDATTRATASLATQAVALSGASLVALRQAAGATVRQVDSGLAKLAGEDPGGLWLARFLLVGSCVVCAGAVAYAAYSVL